MFELPNFGQLIITAFALWLAYYTYKTEKEASKESKVRKAEEKALLDDTLYLTTTRVKIQRHLWTILDKVAAYKIQSVVITDEKEIPQSVLLPYAEYKILQECYDKEEAKVLAPLIEEREANNKNRDKMISHEEMMKRIDTKRAKKRVNQERKSGENNDSH